MFRYYKMLRISVEFMWTHSLVQSTTKPRAGRSRLCPCTNSTVKCKRMAGKPPRLYFSAWSKYVHFPWPVGWHGMWLDLKRTFLRKTSFPSRTNGQRNLTVLNVINSESGKEQEMLVIWETKRIAEQGGRPGQTRERLSARRVTQPFQDNFSKQDLGVDDTQDPSF